MLILFLDRNNFPHFSVSSHIPFLRGIEISFFSIVNFDPEGQAFVLDLIQDEKQEAHLENLIPNEIETLEEGLGKG